MRLVFPLRPDEIVAPGPGPWQAVAVSLGPDMDPIPALCVVTTGPVPLAEMAWLGDPPQEFVFHLEASGRPYALRGEPGDVVFGTWFDGTTRFVRPSVDGAVLMTVSSWSILLNQFSCWQWGVRPTAAQIERAVVHYYEAPRPIDEMAAAWAAREGIT